MNKNIFCLLVLVSLCFHNVRTSYAATSKVPQMEKVNTEILFDDDLAFEHMLKAISRQQAYFKKVSDDVKFQFAERKLTRADLKKSLEVFRKLVVRALNCLQMHEHDVCFKDFNIQMNAKFDAYRPLALDWEKGFATKETLFTAYYSPDFEGSRVKTSVFKNPIYAKPKSAKLRKSSSDAINFGGAFENKGLELFYVKESKYDIWLLHVEGGGRVKVKNADGTHSIYYLSYDGSNSSSFNMLYKYMIEEQMLVKGEATIAKQREYFVNHPQDQRNILKSCPSFIYFKVTETEPLGVKNIPLTVQRSLATDYRRLEEYGIINFIQYKKPEFSNNEVKMVPFSRFFLNQDTGGAIKGNARSDLYFGYGANAELSANYIYGLGKQYYLILKK